MHYASSKPPDRSKTDLRETIAAALRHSGLPRRIEVREQYAEDLPALIADSDQLEIVFLNLIRNAAQAMPEGGQLTITARHISKVSGDLGSVQISFSDTGVGIAPEVMDKIFQPLFSTKPCGMGLGLALCKLLVEGHGGNIQATSTMGKGTTFVVNLPYNAEPSAPPQGQN